MKRYAYLLAGALALAFLTSGFSQSESKDSDSNHPNSFSAKLQTMLGRQAAEAPRGPTPFSIDFPGGTPAQLVQAIEKAMGKPLNAIIPDEDANTQLPPLRMNDVVTPQLFAALEAAGRRMVTARNGNSSAYSQYVTEYGFKTSDNPVTDSSIWYFHVEKPTLPPINAPDKVCRFYSLALFLERGFSVDDITTAIQTGWKMSGVTSPPELKYHSETRLLIVYGEPSELAVIDYVLNALPSSNATRTELESIHKDIAGLKRDVRSLTPGSPTAPGSSPTEKSGKQLEPGR